MFSSNKDSLFPPLIRLFLKQPNVARTEAVKNTDCAHYRSFPPCFHVARCDTSSGIMSKRRQWTGTGLHWLRENVSRSHLLYCTFVSALSGLVCCLRIQPLWFFWSSFCRTVIVILGKNPIQGKLREKVRITELSNSIFSQRFNCIKGSEQMKDCLESSHSSSETICLALACRGMWNVNIDVDSFRQTSFVLHN